MGIGGNALKNYYKLNSYFISGTIVLSALFKYKRDLQQNIPLQPFLFVLWLTC